MLSSAFFSVAGYNVSCTYDSNIEKTNSHVMQGYTCRLYNPSDSKLEKTATNFVLCLGSEIHDLTAEALQEAIQEYIDPTRSKAS